MAGKKELVIEISKTGQVSVTVKCVPGQSCVEETAFLEKALGGAVESRELTSEYFEQTADETVKSNTGNG